MKVAKFLFGLGITVTSIELIGIGMMIFRTLAQNSAIMPNFGVIFVELGGAFVGGGTLIGLSKIIEKLYSKD